MISSFDEFINESKQTQQKIKEFRNAIEKSDLKNFVSINTAHTRPVEYQVVVNTDDVTVYDRLSKVMKDVMGWTTNKTNKELLDEYNKNKEIPGEARVLFAQFSA